MKEMCRGIVEDIPGEIPESYPGKSLKQLMKKSLNEFLVGFLKQLLIKKFLEESLEGFLKQL